MTREEAKMLVRAKYNMHCDNTECAQDHCEACCEAFDMATKALEKQIPKKIKRYKASPYLIYFECPICGTRLQASAEYCRNCGQRIDWSEEEE